MFGAFDLSIEGKFFCPLITASYYFLRLSSSLNCCIPYFAFYYIILIKIFILLSIITASLGFSSFRNICFTIARSKAYIDYNGNLVCYSQLLFISRLKI